MIDMAQTVADLINLDKGIEFKGKTWFSRTRSELASQPRGTPISDMRSDGVHLNDLGLEWTVRLIEEAFKAKPPACASN